MASGSRAGRPRRGRKRGVPIAKLALYPLSVAAGLYAGVKAHAWFAERPAVPATALAASRPPGPERLRSDAAQSTASEQARAASTPEAGRARTEPPAQDVGTRAAPEGERPAQGASGDGAAPRPEPVRAVEIERGAGVRPEVALTFDAGAGWKPAKQILTALQAENVKCTFFLTGEWVRQNPRTTRLIVEQGHELGNHSWDHADFTRLSDAEISSQLRRTEAIVRDTVARSTLPFFRPPLGARDSRVVRQVAAEGYYTIYWTLDSRDSVDPGITAEQIRDRVSIRSAPGSIVLLHCGSQATADAVPAILRDLRARGLSPVTLGRLLED